MEEGERPVDGANGKVCKALDSLTELPARSKPSDSPLPPSHATHGEAVSRAIAVMLKPVSSMSVPFSWQGVKRTMAMCSPNIL